MVPRTFDMSLRPASKFSKEVFPHPVGPIIAFIPGRRRPLKTNVYVELTGENKMLKFEHVCILFLSILKKDCNFILEQWFQNY